MNEHEHQWQISPFVIDTMPPTHSWHCQCGAVTHDLSTGEPCPIRHAAVPTAGADETAGHPHA
jgi:hypothetical protein